MVACPCVCKSGCVCSPPCSGLCFQSDKQFPEVLRDAAAQDRRPVRTARGRRVQSRLRPAARRPVSRHRQRPLYDGAPLRRLLQIYRFSLDASSRRPSTPALLLAGGCRDDRTPTAHDDRCTVIAHTLTERKRGRERGSRGCEYLQYVGPWSGGALEGSRLGIARRVIWRREDPAALERPWIPDDPER